MREIGAVKVKEDKEIPLERVQIRKNMNELKAKLKKNTTTPINGYLFFGVDKINIEKLSWTDPIASQIISDNSVIVENLPEWIRNTFMKPLRQMVPSPLPRAVKKKCNEFVTSFTEDREVSILKKLKHDGKWKETEAELAIVTEKILDTL